MPDTSDAPIRAGRYTLHAPIAAGGMATVHFGQMVGAHGFSRVVAVKRMLPHLASDPHFRAMFVDEARLASRVQHPNVVSILDVVDEAGEVMIVMEYVRGLALSTLLTASLNCERRVPIPIVANIGCAMLAGLHAAHEASDRRGRTLGIVHRDVSPQNVLIGIDGATRIMDFGIARATHLLHASDERQLTGKVPYMAPEQFLERPVDRRTDVFSTAVVLWGALAGRRLFRRGDLLETIEEIKRCKVPPLEEFRADVPADLEAALGQALNPDPDSRYDSAWAFAGAIEAATTLASTRAVADWVKDLSGATVSERDQMVVHIEKTSTAMSVPIAGRAPSVPDTTPFVSEDTASSSGPDAPTSELVKAPPPTMPMWAAPADAQPVAAVRSSSRGALLVGIAVSVIALTSLGTFALLIKREPARPPAAAAPSTSEPTPIAPLAKPEPETPIAPISATTLASAVLDASIPAQTQPRKKDSAERGPKEKPKPGKPATSPPDTLPQYIPPKP